MTTTSWKNKLRGGIVPPLVTPLLAQDTLDVEGTERLIQHVISGGVSGIFILGSSGEGPSLGRQLKRDFCQLCCRIVNGRVPVLVGVSDTSFAETVELARLAQRAGAAAAVLTSPCYFPCSQDDLKRYVRAVLAAIGDDLPLLLYNMPALTKVRFDIETLRELSDCPGIVGVKDSSADLEYFAQLCRLQQERRPDDWCVFMGPEHLAIRAIELGADGVIPGGANVEPRLFVALYETAAAAAANTSEADASRTALDTIAKRADALQTIYEVAADKPWFAALKCACALRNLCGTDQVALPFAPLDDVQRAKVKDILDGLPPPVLFETEEGQH